MNDPLNDPFIEHLKDRLGTHVAPYETGAWENFVRKKKRREKLIYWKRSLSIAASLILVLAFVVYVFFQIEPAHDHTSVEREISRNKDESSSEEATQLHEEGKENTARKNPLKDQELIKGKDHKLSENFPDNETPDLHENTVKKPSIQQKKPDSTIYLGNEKRNGLSLKKEYITSIEPIKPSLKDLATHPPLLFQQTASIADNSLKDKAIADRLTLGIAFTPMMSSTEIATNWNIGGGLSLHWNFMKNLSLSSGLLLAHHQLAFDKESALESADPEHLARMQVNLMSLEVPVNIRYHVYDHLFVSAGLSSATFLKEDYRYSYEYQREIEVVEYSESTGYQVITKTVNYTETETATEPSFNTIDWAAFYTFSMGYNYQLSKKYQLSIEPFVKFPTSEVASRNIKYTSGGLQLKLLFK